MRRRRSLLLALLVLVSGCSSPGPTDAPPTAAVSAPAATGPSQPVSALCDRTSFDLSGETAAIAATRSTHPEFTDDLVAFAASLVPPDAFALSGLTVTVLGPPDPRGPKIVVRQGSLMIRPEAGIAPADFAALLMLELTDAMLKASGVDVGTSQPAANTVAADTYIKLVTSRPDLARGPHLQGRFDVGNVYERLRGHDAYTRPALKKELFASDPDYLAMLVSYFGAEYYHPDPIYADDFDTTFPVPKDRAEALANQLAGCSSNR